MPYIVAFCGIRAFLYCDLSTFDQRRQISLWWDTSKSTNDFTKSKLDIQNKMFFPKSSFQTDKKDQTEADLLWQNVPVSFLSKQKN